MQEKPKRCGEDTRETKEKPNRDPWADDQRERPYYYDDAHGYENFDPDGAADDDDEDQAAP